MYNNMHSEPKHCTNECVLVHCVFFFSLYFSPPFAKIGMRLKKAFQDDRNLSVADKSVPS